MILLLAATEPTNVFQWLGDSSERMGSGAIPAQAWITIWHSLVATAAAVVLAVPLAVWLAHHRKAELLSALIVNIGRVIPTVTIVAVAVLVSLRNGWGFEPWPILIALVAMALPPIFSNTYTAVRNVDENVVSAARAIGTPEWSIMTSIEVPLSSLVILTGIRVAAVQVVATEVIGAFFGGEGLGAYIRQGLGNRDDYEVQAGALLITAVAMTFDLCLYLLSKVLVPKGVGPSRRASLTGTGTRHRPPGAAGATGTVP